MSTYATSPTALRTIGESGVLDALITQIADHVVARLTEQKVAAGTTEEWLDSRHAAEYLGVHRDTLRKLAAERTIPSEQEGPGCKLFFRRAALDTWRQGGGRPRHPAIAA